MDCRITAPKRNIIRNNSRSLRGAFIMHKRGDFVNISIEVQSFDGTSVVIRRVFIRNRQTGLYPPEGLL